MKQIHYQKVGTDFARSGSFFANMTMPGVFFNVFLLVVFVLFLYIEYEHNYVAELLGLASESSTDSEDENIPTRGVNSSFLNESTHSILAENLYPIDNPYERNNSVLNVYRTATFPQVYADAILHSVNDVYGYFGLPGPTQLYMIAGDNENVTGVRVVDLERQYCTNATTVTFEYNSCVSQLHWNDNIVINGNPYVERVTRPTPLFTFMMPLTNHYKTKHNEATLVSYFGRVAIHEAIHTLQFAYGNFSFTYPSGSRWFTEGMADFSEEYYSIQRPGVQNGWTRTAGQARVSFKLRRDNYVTFVAENSVSIREAETNSEYTNMDSLAQYRLVYEGGSLAFLFCFTRASEQSLHTMNTFLQTNYDNGWEAAFYEFCNYTDMNMFYNEFNTGVQNEVFYDTLIDSVFTL